MRIKYTGSHKENRRFRLMHSWGTSVDVVPGETFYQGESEGKGLLTAYPDLFEQVGEPDSSKQKQTREKDNA